ncbi:MAG: VOC family protein [Oligoflexia bacterium]|nr:VOC family protein [Oligoflexia bacterium]
MKNKVSIDHLNLSVKNFKESYHWYKSIFGFELVEEGIEENGPWGILKNGNSMLCIYEFPKRVAMVKDSDNFHQIFHFGLKVENREYWQHLLKENNLKTYYGSPIRYSHSLSWYIKDPTGYMIEVSSWDENKIQFNTN